MREERSVSDKYIIGPFTMMRLLRKSVLTPQCTEQERRALGVRTDHFLSL